MTTRKTLYIDMDGVIADFAAGVKLLDPSLDLTTDCEDHNHRELLVDTLCEANPLIFHDLPPIPGAIETVKKLFKSDKFEIYFLSTPMWNVPYSFKGKRVWLEKHFGKSAYKRLILTHRKDLNIGDYLVDDRTKNGADKFTGELILFGSIEYPNWTSVYNALVHGIMSTHEIKQHE